MNSFAYRYRKNSAGNHNTIALSTLAAARSKLCAQYHTKLTSQTLFRPSLSSISRIRSTSCYQLLQSLLQVGIPLHSTPLIPAPETLPRMCQQQFFRHAGCQHKKPHPTEPLLMCHRAPNRFFGHHCQNLKNTVLDDGPPFCRSCQLQLERRLEGVRRAQEQGWEWTPASFNWGLGTSLSIDEEIERNQVADTGGA